jgi:hypothetical protein
MKSLHQTFKREESRVNAINEIYGKIEKKEEAKPKKLKKTLI